jgi:haloalkane dehalogenase
MDVPTLLVWGSEDPFAPVAGAHRFHKEIPTSQLAIIDGAGHFVWEEQPARTTELLLDFLKRH